MVGWTGSEGGKHGRCPSLGGRWKPPRPTRIDERRRTSPAAARPAEPTVGRNGAQCLANSV